MNAQDTNHGGWDTAYAAIHVRMRFFIAIALLAIIAAIWPWLGNAWERVYARLSPLVLDTTVTSDREYFCPMDPGIVSDWAAICPICNMDLISRRKGESPILPNGVVARMQLTPYRVALAGVRTVEVKSKNGGASLDSSQSESELLIPTTSVVHWGSENLVYVESMPGMYDGIPVKLGEREGESYVVLSGIKPGQRVVAMGTLLIDAETRLNPNLSTQYFGATTQAGTSPPPPPARATRTPPTALDPSEQLLVENQKYCPVTKADLGSMGTPVFVEVGERKVALCCEGCRDRLLNNPAKYLAWLDQELAKKQTQK